MCNLRWDSHHQVRNDAAMRYGEPVYLADDRILVQILLNVDRTIRQNGDKPSALQQPVTPVTDRVFSKRVP